MKKGIENNNSTDLAGKKKKSGAGFIFTLILMLLCAGAVFILGWAQFYVPLGCRAVVVTKTSGVYPNVVKNGKFVWMWQRLLPTNTNIYVFSDDALDFSESCTEKLPSADIFATMVTEKPIFSYDIEMNLKIKAKDEKLVELVETMNIESDAELNEICRLASKEMFAAVAKHLIAKNEERPDFNPTEGLLATFSGNEIKDELGLNEKFPGFEIFNLEIKSASFPDKKLYELARNSYAKFQMSMDEQIKRASRDQADKIIKDQRTVSRLEQIGEVFKKYPELKDAFKNSTINDVLKLAEDD